MSVRAKFKLTRYETFMNNRSTWNQETSKYDHETVESRNLIFNAVVDDKSEENKAFFAATPYGEIKLSTVNQAAWSQFELDKTYYVDFSPAE